MENLNVDKLLPQEYASQLLYLRNLKMSSFLNNLNEYEKSFPILNKSEEILNFKYSSLKNLENKITNEIELLKNNVTEFISNFKYDTFVNNLELIIDPIKSNLTEYKDDSLFCNDNPEDIQDGIKNGIGYFRDKNKNYEFYGNWNEDAHEKGILLKKENENLNEIYCGNFQKTNDGKEYTLDGISINYNKTENKTTMIFGKSSNNLTEGLNIFYNGNSKTHKIYFGNIANSKKSGEGLNIIWDNDKEVNIIYGNYTDNLKTNNFKLYKTNCFLVNVTYGNNDEIKQLDNGVLIYNNSVFFGDIALSEDKKFGVGKQGTLVMDTNNVYIGDLDSGVKHGKGKYYILNEKPEETILLEGNFDKDYIKQGTVHIGITQDKIKKVFEGEFKNNKPFKGIYLYEDNDEYNGELNENFEKHGKGKYISNKSKFEYEGEWLNDKRHGKGSYLTDGKKIEYEWENDIPIKKLTV